MFHMWREEFLKIFPHSKFELFQNCNPYKVDYTVVWDPPTNMHNNMPNLKAIFNIGAGVDLLLQNKGLPNVPIVRLIDPTLKENMFKYVKQTVIRYISYFPDKPIIIGVLGMGVIGEYIIRKFLELEFEVIGYRRTMVPVDVDPSRRIPTYVGREGFEKFCAISDIMINVLPLTKETIGMFNIDMFNMCHGLYLINVGRGEHVINKDLIEAFKSLKVQQATLDVVDKRPQKYYRELLKYRHLTEDRGAKLNLTAHVAGRYQYKSMVQEFVKQLLIVESGGEPHNLVYANRGY